MAVVPVRRLLLAFAAALVFAAPAEAARFRPCEGQRAVRCATVTVPLDRSRAARGRIALHLERFRAPRATRRVVLLIAGGPGQASAGVFDLRQEARLFTRSTLVAFDPRGTGKSGLLRCRGVEGRADAFTGGALAAQAARCAVTLGARRRFFSTRDHVEDIEAVRQELGVRRLVLYGTSYGTKLALAYAQAHPEGVERLLLDSVLPTDKPDPLGVGTLRAIPRALRALCLAGGCSGPSAARSAVALGNRLVSRPLRGSVLTAGGGRRAVRLRGVDYVGLLVEADSNPGLAAELPAAIGAARAGDGLPLLRLVDLLRTTGRVRVRELSPALFLSTVCADGPFPWSPLDSLTTRAASFRAAVAALPPGALGGFGAWAASAGTAGICLRWPGAPTAPLEPVRLPDVPVLALAGDLDTRTPVADALAVVRRFRRGRLLVVPGVGHSVLGADVSGCSLRVVRTWLAGRPTRSRCPRVAPLVVPLRAYPRSVRSLEPLLVPGARGRTLRGAVLTVREVGAAFLLGVASGSERIRVAGLRGGRLSAAGFDGLRLEGYSLVPGLRLTGTLRPDFSVLGAGRLRFVGTVAVCGPRAVEGVVRLAPGGRIQAVLDGIRVGQPGVSLGRIPACR